MYFENHWVHLNNYGTFSSEISKTVTMNTEDIKHNNYIQMQIIPMENVFYIRHYKGSFIIGNRHKLCILKTSNLKSGKFKWPD